MAKSDQINDLPEYRGKKRLPFTNSPDDTQDCSLGSKKSVGSALNSPQLLNEVIVNATMHCEWQR